MCSTRQGEGAHLVFSGACCNLERGTLLEEPRFICSDPHTLHVRAMPCKRGGNLLLAKLYQLIS